MTTFERIKEISKTRGINLKKIATDAGLSENAIYKWKTQTPKIDAISAVADVLGVSVDYLLGQNDKMHSNTTDSLSSENVKISIEELTDVSSVKKRVVSANGTPVSDRDAKLISEYLKALYSKD